LKTILKEELVERLLAGESWVAYRAMLDLLGADETDRAVLKAEDAISKHHLIERIFKGLNTDGYWGTPKDVHTRWPKKNTTFWLLPILAGFGFTVDHHRIARACEYLLST
jgi:hypothetical protein